MNDFKKLLEGFDNLIIENPSDEYKDNIISRLKQNIEANKNVSKLTKDNKIIENSLPFIKLYLDDLEICQNCGSRFIGLCPKAKGKGYTLRLVKDKDRINIENCKCYKYLKVEDIVSKINIFYDDHLAFYVQGRKLINYYNDLDENSNLKNKSEIAKIMNNTLDIIEKKDNKKGYLFSSKKEGLGSRFLKSLALIYAQYNFKVSYVDCATFFNSVFLGEDPNIYNNDYNLIKESDVLLIDNFDLIPKNSLANYEEYIGNLILYRRENNLITYANTTKSYNTKYLVTKYFKDSNFSEDYLNALNDLFNFITIYDEI